MARVSIAGPELSIEASKAMALTFAMHELATNAAKYVALSAVRGRVDIVWALVGNRINLTWTESGGPPVKAPERNGFGSNLLKRALKDDFGEAHSAFIRVASSGLS